MNHRFKAHAMWQAGEAIGRALFLAVPVGGATGIACALFLWALDAATNARFSHPFLLFLLPLSGVLMVWIYEQFGAGAAGGNNLIIDAIHDAQADSQADSQTDSQQDAPAEAARLATDSKLRRESDEVLVPRRMAPLILGATVLTHLCGGSAGREGTAVQMGGALAAAWARLLRLSPAQTRLILMCGLAAGFGGVFGTPLAGAVFALEVLTTGRLESDAALACLCAALISDWVTQALGIHHGEIAVVLSPAKGAFDAGLALKVALGAVAFGLVARLFSALTHGASELFKARIAPPLARPFIGGLLIIALTFLLGTRDYLGLSVASPNAGAVTLSSAFQAGGAGPFSWGWKLLFTAITLGSGFKGGEVTPLFFIGATLGNTLAGWLHAPVGLMAAMGFIGVFAGASNTPLACTLMGIELFGSEVAPYAAIACFLSYLWSGHSGIYLSQRIGVAKFAGPRGGVTLEMRGNEKTQAEDG